MNKLILYRSNHSYLYVHGIRQVVKDVALTISQAMEPVEKGATKIQETFHHISLGAEKAKEEGSEVEVEEHVTENTDKGDVHVVCTEKVIAKPKD